MAEKSSKSNWLLYLITIVAIVALVSTLFLRVEHRLAILKSDIVQNQIAIQALHTAPKSDKNLQLMLIAYLIKMADLTLHTTGESKTALSFLIMAKQYANAWQATAILHALQQDIANLQAVPMVDVEALIMKITKLRQQINTLTIIPPQPVIAKPAKQSSDFLPNVLQALKDIVVVRKRQVEPILPSEQVTTLRLILQAKLLQAEFAIMQKQEQLFQDCLAQAIDLINRYFVLNSSVTSAILQALQELQQVKLQPKFPALTSLQHTQNTL